MSKRYLVSITKKDLEISYFSGTGAGGQHRNKHRNCVRIRHPESGAVATGQDHKSRRANIGEALTRLTKHPRFQIWCSAKAAERDSGKSIEQIVEETMSEENLKVEHKDDSGKWVVV